MTKAAPSSSLFEHLDLPLIVAPMFLVSSVELVTAACANGAIGALPSLNARTPEILDDWLGQIGSAHEARLSRGQRCAPWAVNLVAHTSNKRLQPDLELCVRHKAPVVITALGGPRAVVEAVHSYGGLVFADVNTPEYARKAAASGVDGLVLVCSGAGGHTGPMSAPAFVSAVREFFDGYIVVGGGMSDGASLRAVQAMGADLGYMGTRFIATAESHAVHAYKQMVVDCTFPDIICTNAITGAWANKLRPSLVAAGLDPDNLKPRDRFDLRNREEDAKAWKDLWSAGHGVGQVRAVESTASVIARLRAEFRHTVARLDTDPWAARARAGQL
ncbi:2-nitropropane dioxygenase [Cupriavidus sp. TKC]|uniref:NAD(P)H-dependent flavin oxidoreductase n=1 Tax=Cupriavidus sp. TKC TaxID=2880159 RepID=UPI0025A74AF1|nr:nitronate monooxygenase [Cupriavidus sp. TKC]GMG90501.1 2-nitropropane dioxygenase [Cupriavidus sp. TKC]